MKPLLLLAAALLCVAGCDALTSKKAEQKNYVPLISSQLGVETAAQPATPLPQPPITPAATPAPFDDARLLAELEAERKARAALEAKLDALAGQLAAMRAERPEPAAPAPVARQPVYYPPASGQNQSYGRQRFLFRGRGR